MNTTKDTLVETVRQNPIPAALVGLGLAWLLMNRSSSASQRRMSASNEGGGRGRGRVRGYDSSFDLQEDYQSYGREQGREQGGQAIGGAFSSAGDAISGAQHRVADLAHEATDAAGNVIRRAKDATASTLSSAAEATSHFAHDVRDGASSLAHRAVDATSHFAHDAAETTSHFVHDASEAGGRALRRVGSTVSEYADEVPRQARRAEQAAEGYYMDNPIAVGALALATGALLGMALPRTDREDALLGETRDQFLTSAKGLAHEAVGAVQTMGEDAAQNVKGVLSQSAGA